MNKIDEKATHTGSDAPDSASGRRRFVRGIGVAIPVSLTISARSALSATCTTVSANASIALANSHNATGDVNQPCEGLNPANWTNLAAARRQSRSVYTGLDKVFGDVFWSSSPLSDLTMGEAVKYKDDRFVRYIAAAYLNLVNNKVTRAYNSKQLVDMWTERDVGYSPLPGSTVIWTKPKIEEYLKSTWN